MGNKRPRPARLSEKLLALRRKLNLSQPKLAQQLEVVTYHRVSEYESGRRDPKSNGTLAVCESGKCIGRMSD
jgi:DNA-binding transcriptional regulator YiaG